MARTLLPKNHLWLGINVIVLLSCVKIILLLAVLILVSLLPTPIWIITVRCCSKSNHTIDGWGSGVENFLPPSSEPESVKDVATNTGLTLFSCLKFQPLPQIRTRDNSADFMLPSISSASGTHTTLVVDYPLVLIWYNTINLCVSHPLTQCLLYYTSYSQLLSAYLKVVMSVFKYSNRVARDTCFLKVYSHLG